MRFFEDIAVLFNRTSSRVPDLAAVCSLLSQDDRIFTKKNVRQAKSFFGLLRAFPRSL